jgi:hypothetical protein
MAVIRRNYWTGSPGANRMLENAYKYQILAVYTAKIIFLRGSKNVPNSIWAKSSVFRHLSADKWKYGILVNGKERGEKKGAVSHKTKLLSPKCICEKRKALGLDSHHITRRQA